MKIRDGALFNSRVWWCTYHHILVCPRATCVASFHYLYYLLSLSLLLLLLLFLLFPLVVKLGILFVLTIPLKKYHPQRIESDGLRAILYIAHSYLSTNLVYEHQKYLQGTLSFFFFLSFSLIFFFFLFFYLHLILWTHMSVYTTRYIYRTISFSNPSESFVKGKCQKSLREYYYSYAGIYIIYSWEFIWK